MSGPAKNFLESLYKDNPQIKTEKFDLGEIRHMMAAHQEIQNNTGLDDFDGLSPSQMDLLLRQLMANGKIIRFADGIEEQV